LPRRKFPIRLSMMGDVQYNRVPAMAVLGVALALCLFFGAGAAWRGVRPPPSPTGGADAALADLGRATASGRAGAETWFACGRQLYEQKRFGQAAEAFQRALELEPYHREAIFGQALALAGNGDEKALRAFLGGLVVSDAKLAVNLFARPELAGVAGKPEFRSLAEEARNQASD